MRDTNQLTYTFRQAQSVVDLAVVLADYTDALEQARKIPYVICRTLNLNGVALAIARLSGSEPSPHFILRAGFGHDPSFTPQQALDHTLNGVYIQLQPLLTADPSAPGQTFYARQLGTAFMEMQDEYDDALSHILVFTGMIDGVHRLLFAVHKGPVASGLEREFLDNLSFLAYELAKQLRCAVAWIDSPSILGPPFDTLSEQEFQVLAALKSEFSEKELARELGMSPHALHSRIKSIYRKTGVQGRVPLLLRLSAVRRRLRMDLQTQPQPLF